MMAEQVRTPGGLVPPSGRKLGPQMFLPLTLAEITAGIVVGPKPPSAGRHAHIAV
jgi:hypothetical protein